MLQLVVLTSDKNTKYVLEGLLSRPEALGTVPISAGVFPHPKTDPGVLREAHDFLRSFSGLFSRALVVFDREGCGRESSSREDLEREVESRLAVNGWDGRSAAVVIDPELEAWVWSDSPHVAAELGWGRREPDLKSWLTEAGRWSGDCPKPGRPKEAVEAALREARKPRSSAIYLALAQKVSFARCTDPSFLKLLRTLREWFPASGSPSP
jgi:hypothetical protein